MSLLALLAVPLAIVGDRIADPDFRRRVRARLRARRARLARSRLPPEPPEPDETMRAHWVGVRDAAKRKHLWHVKNGYSALAEGDVDVINGAISEIRKLS